MIEQRYSRQEPGAKSLLHELHEKIRSCDVVVAIVGRTSGRGRPHLAEEAPYKYLLAGEFDTLSYTQWELMFAIKYAKQRLIFGLDSAFRDAVSTRVWRDRSQQQFVRFLVNNADVEKRWERVKSKKDLPARVLAEIHRHPEYFAPEDDAAHLPPAVREHVSALRKFATARLNEMNSIRRVTTLSRPMIFARRTAEANDNHEELHFPDVVFRSLEGLGRNEPFQDLLIVAGAGEGKTTIVLSLLWELAKPSVVHRYRVVPLLVLCVTLHSYFGDDPANDAAALDGWLTLALAPRLSVESSRAGTPPDPTKIAEFIGALKEGGYRLLLLIDGFDELDPSAARANRVSRMLNALETWASRHGVGSVFHKIATTRPYFENIEGVTGLRAVTLKPLTYPEELELAREQQVDPELQDYFCRTFEDLNKTLVYFPALVRYFREYGRGVLDTAISRSLLLEFEIDAAVDELIKLLNVNTSALLTEMEAKRRKAAVRNVLVCIALAFLDRQDPERPGIMGTGAIADIAASLPQTAAILQPMETERLPRKVLNVLVYAGNGTYRLVHNQYRDYLLADGIYRLIRDREEHAGFTPQAAAALTRAYLGAVEVRGFLLDMIERDDKSETSMYPVFSRSVIDLMNNWLPNDKAAVRSDCSPHGAMLSLLAKIGFVTQPPLKTQGVNFHGAVVRSDKAFRIHLPSDDWSGSNLSEADLRGVVLSDSNLCNTKLDNAQLSGADLSRNLFIGANLRNVSMGNFDNSLGKWPTDLRGAIFDDGKSPDAGADWFNYRFEGLKGYYCFFQMELNGSERRVLVSASRGQLVLIDPMAAEWNRVTYLRTRHTDDILDVSSHPADPRLIVTASKDHSVRIHRLPSGEPEQWPASPGDDGVMSCPVEQIACLPDLFKGLKGGYPRRARFSVSGRWLCVIARDPRVAFIRVGGSPEREDSFAQCVFGRAHTGPVMCLGADVDNTINPDGSIPDRFYTAGYDGTVVVWTESQRRNVEDVWGTGVFSRDAARDDNNEPEIIRAVVSDTLAPGKVRDGLWVGTEIGCRLRYYRIGEYNLVDDTALGARFDSGVFALALNDERRLLAVGLASGQIRVYAAGNDGKFDWSKMHALCCTGTEIVRSMRFLAGGRNLIAATWDGGLRLFDINGVPGGRTLQPVRSFDYPEDQWRPELDTDKIALDENVDLTRARGISDRMKHYLRLLARAQSVRPA